MTAGAIATPVVVLVGPTAIGKTELSLTLARRWPCEVVSVDSMQIYRHMDIGTAKASPEERREVPHHLIDIVNPDEEYDAAKFAADARRAIAEIGARGRVALVAGGSGLYLQALLKGIFPGVARNPLIRASLQQRLVEEGVDNLREELFLIDRISGERIHKNDTARLLRALEVYQATGIPWSDHLRRHRAEVAPAFSRLLCLGLTTARDELYSRINRRSEKMLAEGLEEEVRGLLARGYSPELKAMQAIGYRHMLAYLAGSWSREETAELLARDTRRYAKRQYTWFSGMAELQWFDCAELEKLLAVVAAWVEEKVSR